MAAKRFIDRAAYDADTKSTTESTVSLIEEGNEVVVDGVNVQTKDPKLADAVMIDGDKKVVFLCGETVNKDLISEDWTLVGFVYKVEGNDIHVVDKDAISDRLLNASLYRVTGFVLDGEPHDASITLWLKPYTAGVAIPFTYSGTELADIVPQITAALEAKCEEVGETVPAWARLAEDGNGIIVQLDDFPDYRCSNCDKSGGLSISFVSWSLYGNYAAISSSMENICGKFASAVINVARAVIHYSTNGSTPTGNVPVGPGQTLVKKSAFEESEFCAEVRAAYGTYNAYIASFCAKNPQHFGIFSRPDRYWSDTFGIIKVPRKDGTEKFLYGFASKGAQWGYDADGLRIGAWYSNGPRALIELGAEETRVAINATRAKFDLSAVANNVYRWCCVHYSVTTGWHQHGATGAFTYGNTAATRYSGYRVSLYKKD